MYVMQIKLVVNVIVDNIGLWMGLEVVNANHGITLIIHHRNVLYAWLVVKIVILLMFAILVMQLIISLRIPRINVFVRPSIS